MTPPASFRMGYHHHHHHGGDRPRRHYYHGDDEYRRSRGRRMALRSDDMLDLPADYDEHNY